MSTLPPPPEGGDFTPPPAGTFPAICYRVIDLGTQNTTYLGQTKRQHKILVSWEIKDDDAILETDDGPLPMTIHQRYTWSTHEKAALRKDLESWRGKAFTETDFGPKGFNIKNIIGTGCFLGITHKEKDGKTYANITSVSKLPKTLEAGDLVNEKVFFWMSSDLLDRDTLAKLSDGIQNTIKSSPQYQELTNGRTEPMTDADAVTGHLDGPDDEIPF